MQTGLDTDQLIIIGFLAIIFLIIAAAIFVPSFQEKVLGGSEGETSIGGFITVKGASFVLLIIGMASLITYLSVQNKDETDVTPTEGKPPANPSTASAIKVLEQAEDDQYTLDIDEEGRLNVSVNNTAVGTAAQNFAFSLDKSSVSKKNYDIKMGASTISGIQVDLSGTRLAYEGNNLYEKDKAYQLENTDFWFRIEDIKSVQINSGLVAKYQFRFGEGATENTIKWTEDTYEYDKSDNGRQSASMRFLQNTSWQSSYAIALGAGLFGGTEASLHIEKINIYLVEVELIQVQ
ncbi:MAG: hypothetical protein AAGJ93_08285 [Bacteroidota bacterium]